MGTTVRIETDHKKPDIQIIILACPGEYFSYFWPVMAGGFGPRRSAFGNDLFFSSHPLWFRCF